MRKSLFIALLLATALSVYCQQYEYYFLVDTSGSMVGLPRGSENQDIFVDVKSQIKSFLGTIEHEAYVEIIPYDKEMYTPYSGKLSRESLAGFNGFVDGLNATGSVTWIYANLRKLIDRVTATAPAGDKVKTILLYTDGNDTSPNSFSIQETMRHFGLKAAEYGHLYLKYISLNSSLSAGNRDFMSGIRNVSVYDLRDRKEIEQTRMVEIRPSVLDFLTVKGEVSEEREVQVKSNADPAGAVITLQVACPEIDGSGALLEIEPASLPLSRHSQFHKLRLRFHNLQNLPQKEYSGTLAFRTSTQNLIITPDSIPLRFSLLPEQLVEISGDIRDKAIDLGKTMLAKEPVTDWTQPQRVVLKFNQAAVEKMAPVHLFIENDSPFFMQYQGKSAKSLRLFATVMPTEVLLVAEITPQLSGVYSGKLFFEFPQGMKVTGAGLDRVNGAGLPILVLRLRVKKPFPWGVVISIMVGLLAIAGIVFFLFYYCTRIWVCAPPRHIDAGFFESDRPGVENDLPLAFKRIRRKICSKYQTIGGGPSDIRFPVVPGCPWIRFWFQGNSLRIEKLPGVKAQAVFLNNEVFQSRGTMENGDVLRLGERNIKYIWFDRKREPQR